MGLRYYRWTVGGSTVSIDLAPDVITKLREAVTNAEKGQEELGGILLGKRVADDHIAIDGFELIPSEHRRGTTFTLSATDRKKFEQRLGASRDSLVPLGSFRTHLRPGLFMDQYDFGLMSEYFGSPPDVMLLIRPADMQAGFFVWEDGDIHRANSYLQFPFDPAVLPVQLTSPIPPSVAPKSRFRLPVFHIPAIGRAGLVVAAAGLAALLAYYAHGRMAPAARANQQPASSPELAQQAGLLAATNTSAPVDPDVSAPSPQSRSYELRVRVPQTTRPSPFERTEAKSVRATAPPAASSKPADPVPAEPLRVGPIDRQPVETAMNVPVSKPVAPPRLPVVPTVSLEPSEPSAIRRGVNHVPILNLVQRRQYKAGANFQPARPLHQVRPRVPSSIRLKIDNPAVDVKVWIDRNGNVTKTELVSERAQPALANLSATAARQWTFEPAYVSDHPVSSEVVMHFRYAAVR